MKYLFPCLYAIQFVKIFGFQINNASVLMFDT